MYELLNMDCRDVLANMGDDTVDSIVTDPPYHLTSIVKRFGPGQAPAQFGPGQAPAQFGTDGAFARASRGFMGQTWDGGDIAFDPSLWAECLRVLKPGGYLLAFSGTRTYHRMAYAIDEAGFEIRDMLEWLYGSGFPKSHDVGDGRGTALKPAHEPVCMARKSIVGTVAGNVQAWGTGAINIDACRVPTDARPLREADRRLANNTYGAGLGGSRAAGETTEGRFPANVLHDGSPEVLAGFPETTSGGYPPEGGQRPQQSVYGKPNARGEQLFTSNSGSAARFFYCAKASKADREVGRPEGVEGDRFNVHPTVKPTELMRWLVRLVTPPGGLVFDPFTGSGSTGRGAILEGRRFIGAEMTVEYIPIARARIDAAVNGK